MTDQDTPSLLADLIAQCGIDIGQLIGDAVAQCALRIDATIRAAFAHGVIEGMEVAAQMCEASIPLMVTAYSAAHADAALLLRDNIRMGALQVEVTR